jgi:uncharacterized membrane protein YidH (DUF202 family)
MSAQKTALVCLVFVIAILVHDLAQLTTKTRAAILLTQHSLSVTLCLGAQQDACALVVSVDRTR